MQDDDAADYFWQLMPRMLHDLSAPLRHSRVYGELLAEDGRTAGMPAGLTATLEKLLLANSHQKQLFDAVVALHSVLRHPLELAPVQLRSIVVDAWNAESGKQDLDARCEIDADVPNLIAAEARRLKMAIAAVINNSIRYRNSDRRLEIHITAELQPSRVMLRIADNGRSIAQSFLPKATQPFESLPVPECERGAGLGLAIAERILYMHGGQLAVESDGSSGTCVMFDIPNGSGNASNA